MLAFGSRGVAIIIVTSWTILTQSDLGVLSAALTSPTFGDDRIVFQTEFGDIEMALYADVRSLPDRLTSSPRADL